MRERLPRIKWPHTYPICTLFGIVMALLVTVGAAYVQVRLLHPLQRYYLGSYLQSCVLPIRQNLSLVEVWNGDSSVIAVDPWVDVQRFRNATRLRVTPQGAMLGFSRPRLVLMRNVKPQAIRPFFQHTLYRATIPAIFRLTLCIFALALAAGMIIGAWLDRKHQEAARNGVQIRGPRILSPKQANKYLRGDGIALLLEPKTK
jgi:hypothetical protein